jgi:hypothetical protein
MPIMLENTLADCLITGNGAQLKLKQYEGVPIIQASAFGELERQRASRV